MKREELYRKKYRTENELYQSIDEYMIFYNTRRPHSKIQYKTPEQKEKEYDMIFRTTESEQMDYGARKCCFDFGFFQNSHFSIFESD